MLIVTKTKSSFSKILWEAHIFEVILSNSSKSRWRSISSNITLTFLKYPSALKPFSSLYLLFSSRNLFLSPCISLINQGLLSFAMPHYLHFFTILGPTLFALTKSWQLITSFSTFLECFIACKLSKFLNLHNFIHLCNGTHIAFKNINSKRGSYHGFWITKFCCPHNGRNRTGFNLYEITQKIRRPSHRWKGRRKSWMFSFYPFLYGRILSH